MKTAALRWISVMSAIFILFGTLVGCSVSRDVVAPIKNVYICSNTEKVLRYQTPPRNGGDTLTAGLAKNEGEGLQFILRFSETHHNVKVSVSEIVSDSGETLSATLYRQKYVSSETTEDDTKRIYPDALVPMFDGSDGGFANDVCDIAANENQGYWITLNSVIDQKPGIYTGTVSVSFDGGSISIPIEAEVWNFALPQTPSMETGYGYWTAGDISSYYEGVEGADAKQLEEMVYETLLTYRITSGDVPISWDGDIDDVIERLRPYAEDPRVTSFNVPYKMWGGEDNGQGGYYTNQWNNDLYNALKENNFIDKAYYYFIDEPTPDRYEFVKYFANQVHEFSEIPLIMTSTPIYELYDSIDFWCGNWAMMGGEVGTYILKQQNEKVWWYGCMGPLEPAPNYHVTGTLLSARMVRFMQKDYNIQGDLYWSTTLFRTFSYQTDAYTTRDIWNCADSWPTAPGDGFLWYPGTVDDGIVNRNIFVPSLRLEVVRDGIEDFDYLTLLEQKYTKALEALGITDTDVDSVMEMYYESLYTSLSDFDRDPSAIQEMRKIMAHDIMADDGIIACILPSLEQDSAGKLIATVFSEEPAVVLFDGEAAVGSKKDNGWVYTAIYDAEDGKHITVTCNGDSYVRILAAAVEAQLTEKLQKNAIDSAFALEIWDLPSTEDQTECIAQQAKSAYERYVSAFSESEDSLRATTAYIDSECDSKIPTLYFIKRISLKQVEVSVYVPAGATASINGSPCTFADGNEDYSRFVLNIPFDGSLTSSFELTVAVEDKTETTVKLFTQEKDIVLSLADFSSDTFLTAVSGVKANYFGDKSRLTVKDGDTYAELLYDGQMRRFSIPSEAFLFNGNLDDYSSVMFEITNCSETEVPPLSLSVTCGIAQVIFAVSGNDLAPAETRLFNVEIDKKLADFGLKVSDITALSFYPANSTAASKHYLLGGVSLTKETE